MPALVFSNACQSGQSNDWSVDDQAQRIFGLANAFLLSGVQHYIGTFWETVDEPSSDFAKRFYAAIADGKAIGISLRDARRAPIVLGVIETLAWTNYMLYGDPGREYGVTAEISTKILPERLYGQWKRIFGAGKVSAKVRSSQLLFSLLGALLLSTGYIAYSWYDSLTSDLRYNLAAHPVMHPAKSVAPIPSSPMAVPLSLSMNIVGQRKEPDGGYIEVIVREEAYFNPVTIFRCTSRLTNPRTSIFCSSIVRARLRNFFPIRKSNILVSSIADGRSWFRTRICGSGWTKTLAPKPSTWWLRKNR